MIRLILQTGEGIRMFVIGTYVGAVKIDAGLQTNGLERAA